MKSIILFIAACLVFISCKEKPRAKIMLLSGESIIIKDYLAEYYDTGDTVYIEKHGNEWKFSASGIKYRKDTILHRARLNDKNDTMSFPVECRLGIVLGTNTAK